MGDKVVLTVENRDITGKKVRRLRKQGIVPAVVYGSDMDATPVMAQVVDAEKAWRDAGRRQPIELNVGGKKRLAMIKSADLEPVKRRLRHLSLHVVKQNEKVETQVPVHIVGGGETPAEKAGLVVLKTIDAVAISALPNDLPDAMQVSGESLAEPGDNVTVADIEPIKGVEIQTELDQVVATVYEPGALAAANEAAAGDATDESEVEAEAGADEASQPEGEQKIEKSSEESK